jgi:hypothetical protein
LIRLLQEKYRYTPQHAQDEFDQRRGSLHEIIERRVEEEFSRRLAKIEARQKIHDFT